MAAKKKVPTLAQYKRKRKSYLKGRRTPQGWNVLMESWAKRVTQDIRNIESYLKAISGPKPRRKITTAYVPKT
jgi:hypothetical protein